MLQALSYVRDHGPTRSQSLRGHLQSLCELFQDDLYWQKGRGLALVLVAHLFIGDQEAWCKPAPITFQEAHVRLRRFAGYPRVTPAEGRRMTLVRRMGTGCGQRKWVPCMRVGRVDGERVSHADSRRLVVRVDESGLVRIVKDGVQWMLSVIGEPLPGIAYLCHMCMCVCVCV